MAAYHIQLEKLVNVIKPKVSLQGPRLFAMVSKWAKRFTYELCFEVFQNMPDLKYNSTPIPYVEKILQYEFVKRNPQPMRELTSLAQGMSK